MTDEEVPKAIEFEARHHIPLPLSEVTFDWQIIERKESMPGVKLKVLLVAVPNKVLESYQRLAALCDLEVQGMEAEVFGLMRTAVAENHIKKTVCLVDFGWQSTAVSIVENKSLKTSQSFDVSGVSLTKNLSLGLAVSMEEAEKLKKQYGLDPQKEDVYKILLNNIGSLAADIENVCQVYSPNEGKSIDDIVLAGGTSLLKGLKDYLSKRIRKNVYLADPFATVSFPSALGPRLKELGPSFSVSLGVAMMGAEA